jgi:hypothetical protein
MRSSVVALLAVALIAFPASAAPPQARYLVVPGIGMGPIRLGMKVHDVEAILGAPARVDRDPRTVWYTWRDASGSLRSIAVEALDDLVILISVAHDERYRTREGVGPGDTDHTVQEAFGRPSGVLHLPGYDLVEYKARGITFVVDTGAERHHVTGVVVAARL